MDLERLGRACRDAGAYFVVDAIQSLGSLPIDVRALGIDVLATGGQKWLCSPFGTGFLYVRGALAERLAPPFAGWVSTPASDDLSSLLDYDWSPFPDARRFEVGTLPFECLSAFAHSLELIVEADPAAIEGHLSALLDPLLAWAVEREVPLVSDPTPERRSGIVALRPPDPETVSRHLMREGIVASVREGALRVSPHLYNTPAEMERLLLALDGALAR
jgi:cysteine desulfurase / selenocysteine lyase